MKATVTYPDGRVAEITFTGDNFSLGLAAVLHKCIVCGASEFVDGGDHRECPCGTTYDYSEDEQETLGYLH